MYFLNLVFLLILSSHFCICKDATEDESDDKSTVQVVSGKKGKKLQNLVVAGSLYNPYVLFNYPEPGWRASATLISDANEEGEKGTVSFHQWGPNNIVRVDINVTELAPGKHAVHIHAFGDIAEGCKSTGPHMQSNFIGNIEVKEDGTAETSFFAPILTMFGYHGIVGRSVVIHKKPIEVLLQPEIFSSPYYFLPRNAISLQTEESQVGAALACGPITIKANQS